jgi:hypothetical protein
MAVAANQSESKHPLSNYYFIMLFRKENYLPNKIDYNPVKMPFVMPLNMLRDKNYSITY